MKMMVSKFGIFSFQKSIFGFHISLREWKKNTYTNNFKKVRWISKSRFRQDCHTYHINPIGLGRKEGYTRWVPFYPKVGFCGKVLVFGSFLGMVGPCTSPYSSTPNEDPMIWISIQSTLRNPYIHLVVVSSRWIIHNDFLQVIHVISPWSWSDNGAKTSDQPEIFLQTVKRCALLFMDKIRQKPPVDTVDGSEIRQTTRYISFPDHCHCIFMKLYEKVTQSWLCDWYLQKKNSMGSFSRVKYTLFLPESYLSRKRPAFSILPWSKEGPISSKSIPPMGVSG